MLPSRFARPADEPAAHPVAVLAAPSRQVDATTVFDPDAQYRVQLSASAEYLGSALSPMHVHTVGGAVAEAVRDSIAAFDNA